LFDDPLWAARDQFANSVGFAFAASGNRNELSILSPANTFTAMLKMNSEQVQVFRVNCQN
jgi:hypothetical protein